MKCPKCGYQRQHRDDLFVAASECPACGVVYTKYTASEPPAVPSMESSKETDIPTSPVHADSLRQARERVEMRLRKRTDMRLQDTRKAQTLARARHIATEAMRQRQAQGPIRSEAALDVSDTLDDLWVPAPVAPDGVIECAGESTLEKVVQPTPDTESDTILTTLDSSGMAATGASTDTFSLPRLLPLVAWLALGVGISGALLSWITVDTGQAVAGNGPGNTTGSLPVAFLLGFAYLATGVLGFGVFWVASVITRQLEDIRARLFSQSAQTAHTGDAFEPNRSHSQLTR
ncbi:MAG: hypothetical protein KFF50_16445 [Desulfatitalea sp.]|nr:hypothetical protein [Desulfatitalea sp.]